MTTLAVMSSQTSLLDFISQIRTPERAVTELREASETLLQLQMEILQALDSDIGYSLGERIRLRLQLWKYNRLQSRINKAMILPQFQIPPRHDLIERTMGSCIPAPADLSAALDELEFSEDGVGVVVGPLSQGQRAQVYARAKRRGFVVGVRRMFDDTYQLTRLSTYEG